MADVEKIENMIAEGKKVEIEWHKPYEKGNFKDLVKFVRWDGLVFTENDAVFTGCDKLIAIREA